MTIEAHPTQIAEIISAYAPKHRPKLGLVLGSGLGEVAEQITDAVVIPYSDLPGFPVAGNVKGHGGQLVLGNFGGMPVACLQGRSHLYETGHYQEIRTYVRTLQAIGCEYYFSTNAAGSFHENIPPGSLVLINDHINFQPGNPLIGPNDEAFGPRFPTMDNVYDPQLRDKLQAHAKDLDITLHEGVYIAVTGPCYETAAEIRAFGKLGADVVGMSTVPEVIVATHCGMRVCAVSIVTNYATGLSVESHDHDNVLAEANRAAKDLVKLIQAFASSLNES